MEDPGVANRRELDPQNLRKDEHKLGNNAAFTCPHCDKVFLVSTFIHEGEADCPDCGESRGFFRDDKVWIEW